MKYSKEYIGNLTLSQCDKLAKKDKEFEKAYIEYMAESFKPLVNLFNNLKKTFDQLEKNIPIIFKGLAQFVQKVNESGSLIEIILSGPKQLFQVGWILSPYLFKNSKINYLQIYRSNKIKTIKSIDKIFINFFFSDNFFHLKYMINSWKTNTFFQRRMKLLSDSIKLIENKKNKNLDSVNVASFIIPLLIAQIDGIINDFLVHNKYSFKKGKIYYNDQIISKADCMKKEIKAKTKLSNYFAFKLIEEVLFGKTYYKEDFKYTYKSYNYFNRHKIMHGESLKYGTIKNLIRVYLVLDYLFVLTNTKTNLISKTIKNKS